MCKVMMFTNFKKVKNVKSVVEYIGARLLETERDGFGFAIQGQNGVYGEKFLGDSKSYESESFVKNKDLLLSENETVLVEKLNLTFGEYSKTNGGALFHGRISTNKGGFKNTHPIIKHDWTLIHNGVVTNHGPEYKMITDNDTEHLVENLSQGGIDMLSKNLTGYYAFGAFDPKGNLHIGRDSIAWLYMAKIPKLDTIIFATTKELIQDFCNEFNYERSTINKVKDDIYMVFNTNGEMITDPHFFKSRGYGKSESSHMSKSLSYMFTGEQGDIYDASSSGYDQFSGIDYNNESVNSYYAYLSEIENQLDESYSIYNAESKRITVKKFKMMDEDAQLDCTVVRPDGTICAPKNYDVDKLYEGRY